MDVLTAVIMAGAAACAVTTVGILAVLWFEKAAHRYAAYFVSFAAGVLITVAFLHLVPHALKMGAAPGFVLAGLLGLYLLDRLADGSHDDPGRQRPDTGLVPLVGIGLHSLLDGGIFAVTFSADLTTGFLAALGMVLHEFPEGIIMATLLLHHGYARRKAAWTAFFAAGVSTPVGALVAYPLVDLLAPAVLGPLLALSGGALVYLGVAHLLPITLKKGGAAATFWLAAGVVLALLALTAKQA